MTIGDINYFWITLQLIFFLISTSFLVFTDYFIYFSAFNVMRFVNSSIKFDLQPANFSPKTEIKKNSLSFKLIELKSVVFLRQGSNGHCPHPSLMVCPPPPLYCPNFYLPKHYCPGTIMSNQRCWWLDTTVEIMKKNANSGKWKVLIGFCKIYNRNNQWRI